MRPGEKECLGGSVNIKRTVKSRRGINVHKNDGNSKRLKGISTRVRLELGCQ